MRLSTFADVHAAIAPYWHTEVTRHNYGLDHMFALLEYLGDPQEKLKVVHVAGTSGKTSTAYYAAALLQATGRQVGMTVSPHVDEVNERVQINLTPLPEAEFAARFGEYLALVRASGITPNYFELFIAFAFWEFAARGVDYAVVEVGIGGLLDSTNVISRQDKVCVITDIGLDHTKVLGITLAEIAAQKAGIIRLHNKVFCYRQSAEVTDVIKQRASAKHADLTLLGAVPQAALFDFLPLFQQRNLGLALCAVQSVAERDNLPTLTPVVLHQAAQTYIPARMELYRISGKTLILDAAHNEQKFQGLLGSVRKQYGGMSIAALVRLNTPNGPARRASASIRQLTSGVQHIIITSVAEEDKGFNPARITQICQAAEYESFEIIPDSKEAFTALLKRPEPVVLVAGSFLLLNHIRPLLKRTTKA